MFQSTPSSNTSQLWESIYTIAKQLTKAQQATSHSLMKKFTFIAGVSNSIMSNINLSLFECYLHKTWTESPTHKNRDKIRCCGFLVLKRASVNVQIKMEIGIFILLANWLIIIRCFNLQLNQWIKDVDEDSKL